MKNENCKKLKINSEKNYYFELDFRIKKL